MKPETKNALESVAAAGGVNAAVWTIHEISLYLQAFLAAISIVWVAFQILRAWEDREEKRRQQLEGEDEEKGP
jgi:threonine/homoserine/homoserine lactone efflux protein